METVPRVLFIGTRDVPRVLFIGTRDGAEDCITSARRLWRAELGSSPRRRPTRRRASPAPLFRADGGRLSIGWISCWT